MTLRLAPLFSAIALAAVLGGCAAAEPEPSLVPADPDVTTMTYRDIDGAQLEADVCTPDDAGDASSPAVILLHGGGFSEGSRTSMAGVCTLLADAGVVGVTIDYRLLPENAFPDQVEDAAAALEWLSSPEVSTELGVDPARIGMFGSSAGAIIAATLGAQGAPNLAGVIALSPVSDMTENGLALGDPAPEAVQLILAYLACTDVADCPQAADASPITHVSATSTPMLLVGGSDEIVPLPQVEALDDALENAGVPSELVVVDGTSHGLSLLTADVRSQILTFIDEYL